MVEICFALAAGIGAVACGGGALAAVRAAWLTKEDPAGATAAWPRLPQLQVHRYYLKDKVFLPVFLLLTAPEEACCDRSLDVYLV